MEKKLGRMVKDTQNLMLAATPIFETWGQFCEEYMVPTAEYLHKLASLNDWAVAANEAEVEVAVPVVDEDVSLEMSSSTIRQEGDQSEIYEC